MPTQPTSVSSLSNVPTDLPNIPANYPLTPKPGKVEMLLNANSNYLYEQFNPYTNFQDSLLSQILPNQQPFVYTFIDKKDNSLLNKVPSTVRSLLDLAGINNDSVTDVVRVSKFLTSTWGVQFLASQVVIQRLASFDETRIYNPLSPLLATVQPLTLGIGDLPIRHVEGGLLGLANSITSTVGINLQNGYQTPASTAGNTALSTYNTGQGKGLIRGGDAGKGYAQIQFAWPVSSTPPGQKTGVSALTSAISNAAGQLFGTANINQPKGTQVRADEGTYGFMSVSPRLGLQQPWFAPMSVTLDASNYSPSPSSKLSTTINNIVSAVTNPIGTALGVLGSILAPPVGGNKVVHRTKFIAMPDGTFKAQKIDSGFYGETINGKTTGYDIAEGDTYGKDVGKPMNVGDVTNSDMLVQFSYYLDEINNYPTKMTNQSDDSVIAMNNTLKQALNDIRTINTYTVLSPNHSSLLPLTTQGYTAIANIQPLTANKNQKGTTSGEYAAGDNSLPKPIDAQYNRSNLKMATSFMSDGLNMLGVVPQNQSINTGDNVYTTINNLYPGWTEWSPYDDDLIAFYFYDVVNSNYIPFRATVKGISEGNNAFWEELRFIGRADQLYSYNGFSRTLNFSFNIVISSVTELLPSWKKINYLASCVKPATYTNGQSFNKFIVPPMFMLTIGDLYKFQPVVITNVNINVPDDAAWETLNENNSPRGWSYLNGIITSPNLGKNYGQLPREVEVTITCNLLEKERAVVGGSHFGHEPRVDDWENQSNTNDRFVTGTEPYLPPITTLHEQLVVWNSSGTPNTATSNGSTQNRTNAATMTNAAINSNTVDLNNSPSYAGNVAASDTA